MTRAEQAARLKNAKAGRAAPVQSVKIEPVKQPAPIVPVLLAPIVPADPEPTLSVLYPASRAFDPSEHPVSDVLAYMDANPDQAERIVMAESEGKGRKSIIARGE